MRVVYWGSPDFAVFPLQRLVASEHEIVGVVSQPDKRKGRKKRWESPPVAQFAKEQGLRLFQPESARDTDFVKSLRELSPDMMVVVAYGQILSSEVLEIPRLDTINVHFSLLPKYRGASPIASAILAGDVLTGVSIMRMVKRMDAGPVYAQKSLTIAQGETTGSLEEKLAQLSGDLLVETMDKIEKGEVAPSEQVEERATYCWRLTKKSGEVPWEKSAQKIVRFVRAMSPWPTAHTWLQRAQGKQAEYIILKDVAAREGEREEPPGTIVGCNKEGIVVVTGEGLLVIQKLQKAGKAALKAEDFVRGNAIQPGDLFFHPQQRGEHNG